MTPRTDAAAIGFARLLVDRDTEKMTEIIPADFARELETELDEAKAEIAAMRKAMQVAVDAIEGWYK